MFEKNTHFLLVCLFALGCKPSVKQGQIDAIKVEIDNLSTDELKKSFLINILNEDQGQRETDDPDVYKNDLVRGEQISYYLEKYGYPSKEKLGEKASFTPYIVIHHSPTDDLRFKHFSDLYKAYRRGDISPDTFAFYLGRFQKNVNGKWIEFDGPFTVEDEIDTLVLALGLTEAAIDIAAELQYE